MDAGQEERYALCKTGGMLAKQEQAGCKQVRDRMYAGKSKCETSMRALRGKQGC